MILAVNPLYKPELVQHQVRLFSHMPRWFRLRAVFLVLSLTLGACSGGEAYLFTGDTMGTQYNVRVLSEEGLSGQAQKSLGEGIFRSLDRVDILMSSYRPDSEISELNGAPVNEPMRLSPETFEVLAISKDIYRLSKGAFDISLSPLIEAWGFGTSDEPRSLPSTELLAEAGARVGMDKVALDRFSLTATKLAPVELNVSAIAKGYGVDRVVEFLDSRGFKAFLVEVGGEIYARGLKHSGEKWVLGVETPDFPGRKAITTVALENKALATSGDYRNFIERDGVRYSHTLDPRTMAPVDHHLASVSVIAERCVDADALATALMVLGDEHGVAFAESNSLDALFIVRGESGFDVLTTGHFSRLQNRGMN